MPYSLEFLQLRTAEERWRMYQNARLKLDDPAAKALIALIDEHQLSMLERGGFPAEHPAIMAIREVCFSKAGVEAAIGATQAGLPALAHVDPLLSRAVPAYVTHPDTHTWAGGFVAEAMEQAGYRRLNRSGKLPEGCAARTAMMFALRT